MRKKLYDCVAVHGLQGQASYRNAESTSSADGEHTRRKAYACTNCMEFFAELSTAYHYHLDERLEYNKWFPFNRAQLQQHDPSTYSILVEIWNQHETEKQNHN